MNRREKKITSFRVKKAVIPAAGLGVRFLPATKAQPKEMLPIVDIPTIQYVVEEAVRSGITDILIVTGRGKRAIEDHFDRSIEVEYHLQRRGKKGELKQLSDISNLANIHYIRQREPLGLGHAILCARQHVGDEPFAVLLGDDVIDSEEPCTAQLVRLACKYRSTVVGVEKVPEEKISNYGCVDACKLGPGNYRVRNMIEKPSIKEAPSNLAIIGRYVITPTIFEILEKTAPGKSGEIQLTDALVQLLKKEDIYACEFQGKRYDVGDKAGYVKATIDMALKRQELRDEIASYIIERANELQKKK